MNRMSLVAGAPAVDQYQKWDERYRLAILDTYKELLWRGRTAVTVRAGLLARRVLSVHGSSPPPVALGYRVAPWARNMASRCNRR